MTIKKAGEYGFRRLAALILTGAALVSCLAGCGGEAAAVTTEKTQPTEPTLWVPEDGNPDDVTCKGSYTDAAYDRSTVVGKTGEAELTAGMLNVLYRLVINGFRNEREMPDFSIPLESQVCGLSEEGLTWQQYFLQQALDLWHGLQSLEQKSHEYVEYVEDYFEPDPVKHKEYMTNMPAAEVMLTKDGTYRLNTMEEEFLEDIPRQIAKLSMDQGYENLGRMLSEEFGEAVTRQDLESVTHLINYTYFYFMARTYDLSFTEEELKEAEKKVDGEDRKLVTIRNLLILPENAEFDEDGRVTASQEDWEKAELEAKEKLNYFLTPNRLRIRRGDESEFAQDCYEVSKDTATSRTGGIYANLHEGQIAEPLNSWAFDPERKQDDVEIVKSEYGVHLLYFCGSRTEKSLKAEHLLRREIRESALETAAKDYPAEVEYEKIRLAPVQKRGKLLISRDLLYPDVAHERFTEVPLFLQQDWMHAPFAMGYMVGKNGCGITSFAMLSTYMTDTLMTPGYCARTYSAYGGVGTDGRIFEHIPPKLGYFFIKKSGFMDEVQAALREGKKAISLQHVGYFTRGGHYLVLSDITEEGNIVIRDSNIFNYRRCKEHAVDEFNPNLLLGACQGFWILDSKMVRTKACVRCGGEYAPKLLQEDYFCPRCQTARERRSDFLELLKMA